MVEKIWFLIISEKVGPESSTLKGNDFDATYSSIVLSKIHVHVWVTKEKKYDLKIRGQNTSEESFEAQWKSDFRMSRYSFGKLVDILTLQFAKQDTNFRKAIPIQCDYCLMETFDCECIL